MTIFSFFLQSIQKGTHFVCYLGVYCKGRAKKAKKGKVML